MTFALIVAAAAVAGGLALRDGVAVALALALVAVAAFLRFGLGVS